MAAGNVTAIGAGYLLHADRDCESSFGDASTHSGRDGSRLRCQTIDSGGELQTEISVVAGYELRNELISLSIK